MAITSIKTVKHATALTTRYIDSNLTMKNQISNTVKVCNHHLRNIAFIRKYLNEDMLKMLIHNHVISRLDYCNSIYHNLPNILLKKRQNIQNRAARPD